METQFGRKPPLSLLQPSKFIIKKTSYNHVLVQTQTSTQAPTCRRLQPSLVYQPFLEGSYDPLNSFTNLSWKGATTPWTRLPAFPGRELQPPTLVYQPLLEGSYYPLILFTSYHWKGATTPSLKASTFSTTADHVSSIFKLDQTASTQPFIFQQTYFAQCFKQNSDTTVTRISEITQTSE